MDLSFGAVVLVAVASVLAGAVNAVAGGGTLLAFPSLTFVGVPTVEANLTTTVSLTPGYLGGTLAQRIDLRHQVTRALRLVVPACLGGLSGALLLVVTSEGVFRRIVPWLIFAACGLLASQDRVRAYVDERQRNAADQTDQRRPHPSGAGPLAIGATFVASLYGGYFGGGLGIILLAVLGLLVDDELRNINALKQLLALATNVSAAVLLLFSGRVQWEPAVVMASGSLVGGLLGGRVAGRIDARKLRRVVITIGVVIGVIYLVRG